ncbi:MAG: outer membrane protein assembly factor BamD [Bdellovibrionota bacterium]
MKFLRHIAILSKPTWTLGLLVSFMMTACSSAPTRDTSTPEGAFLAAEDMEKDERYEEAIQQYSEVKNKHPYSRFATEAELKIGDLQFTRESYIDAQGAYQLFKEFHPKHPRIDYVTYRLAMSYYNQLPSTIDRDLSLAEKAILYFDETINSYPTSTHVKESREKREAALKMLGEKEMYIASFYLKRKQFDSALKRYEMLIKTYPNLGFDAAALYGAAKSSFEVGEKERGNQHLKNLYSLYPSSDEAKRAKDDFGTN